MINNYDSDYADFLWLKPSCLYFSNSLQHSDYASSLGYLRNVVQGQHLSQPIKHTSFVLIDQSNGIGEILNSGDVTKNIFTERKSVIL